MVNAHPLVALRSISKAYPGILANDHITIDLRAGEIHAIVGENGAGKTTLMEIASGLRQPDTGEILVADRPTELKSARHALAIGIGLVQQHFSLIPTLTVAENLVLALRTRTRNIDRATATRQAKEVAQRYVLPVELDTPVEDLTISQQQRAELIKALVLQPRILILDEPTSLLTPQEARELARVLRQLAGDGVGIFLIAHKLDEVLSLADRITVLRHGRHVATLTAAEATRERLAQLMVGTVRIDPNRTNDGDTTAPGSVLLQVTDLFVVGDRGGLAVRGATFDVRAGEVLGIAGLDSSGQVELLEAIVGARPVLKGSVHLAGQDVTSRPVKQRRDLGVAHIPADRGTSGLVTTMTVAENLVLPVVDEPAFSRLGTLRHREIGKRARDLSERFDIRPRNVGALGSELSGGNQQKLVLARELSGGPRVICACYVTRGLDFAAAAAVRDEILASRGRGGAILYASLDLDELLAVADRVMVLHRGEVAGILTGDEVTAERLGLLMGGARAT